MREHSVLFFDVESSFLMAPVWRAHDNYVAPERLKHDTHLLTWAAKWADTPAVMYGRLTPDEAVAKDDRRIAGTLADLIRSADKIVAHNGDRFDLPLINGRILYHNLEPLALAAGQKVDTLKLARRSFKIASNKLDYLAQFLGVPTKLPMTFDVWEGCYRGDPDALYRMDRYCRQDVRVLERVFWKLAPHVEALPRMVDADVAGEHVCPYCGSDRLHRRGTVPHRTNVSTWQRWQCTSCRRWSRTVKADPDAKLNTRTS